MNRRISLPYLWTRRSFVSSLVYRDIRNRYAHSMLGLGWMVFEPLLFVLAMSLIFSRIGRIGYAKVDVPFPLFFYVGVLPWNLFARALTEGSRTFVNEAELLRKFSFPREILVAKNLLLFFIEFLIASLALGVVMLIYRFPPNSHWLWLLPVLLIECMVCLGMMLGMASLNVYLRDVGTFLGACSSIFFWLSPIIYRVEPKGPAAAILYLNPMAGIIEACRMIILDDKAPSAATLLFPLAWSVALLAVGYGLFSRLEKGFVDAV